MKTMKTMKTTTKTMKTTTTITVKNQQEFDNIPLDFEGNIYIVCDLNHINKKFPDANLYIHDKAVIREVSGSAIIREVSGSAVIRNVYDSAVIREASGSAIIQEVHGSAVIQDVHDSAVIKYVYGSAVIRNVFGSAVIRDVHDSAVIQEVHDSAVIREASGSAVIRNVFGSAVIQDVHDSAVIQEVYGQVIFQSIDSSSVKIEKASSSVVIKTKVKDFKIQKENKAHIIYVESFYENPTFELYKKKYPIEVKGKKTILYKAVMVKDGKYFSNYDEGFEYEVGKTYTEAIDKSNKCSCSSGLHLSHLRWAERFSKTWKNKAILKCETDIKNIVVSKDCDGKIRTSKLKVLEVFSSKL